MSDQSNDFVKKVCNQKHVLTQQNFSSIKNCKFINVYNRWEKIMIKIILSIVCIRISVSLCFSNDIEQTRSI